MNPGAALTTIKAFHTVVWAFFAACILAIPFVAHAGAFFWSAILFAVVLLEVAILATNHGRCPLTTVAARYTPERQAHVDIYLPLWLARYNKAIFGALFVAGSVYAFYRWWQDSVA